MDFNVEGKWCIERAANDLKLLGAKFTIKPVQQLRKDPNMNFLCIPITVDPSIVKELVDNVLKPLALELMKNDPTHVPAFSHGSPTWWNTA